MIPLIKGFRADSYWKAFILGSLVASLVAVGAVETRQIIEKEDNMKNKPEYVKGLVTFGVAFLLAMIVYSLMYILFEYGGGMLVRNKK